MSIDFKGECLAIGLSKVTEIRLESMHELSQSGVDKSELTT